jgi:hypothetical protein
MKEADLGRRLIALPVSINMEIVCEWILTETYNNEEEGFEREQITTGSEEETRGAAVTNTCFNRLPDLEMLIVIDFRMMILFGVVLCQANDTKACKF